MGTTKSSMSGKQGGTAKADQASAYAKGVIARRRINVQMVQCVLLIWLDNNIDENSIDCQNTITQLQCAINTINLFTDGDQCIQFLEDMVNDKACMIISGSLGQYIVPLIHNMFQVDSIFIFCRNKKRHKQWTKEWPKIKGVFTEIAPICEALKQTVQQCEKNTIPISFVATSDDPTKNNLDQLEPSFMYTQILKEILLTIDFQEEHVKEFIEYCREALFDNLNELENVKKLEHQYRNETPIWWYTYECFLYSMLNHTLRLMDIDLIIKMGFFIVDLHRHIERLHLEQFGGDNSSNSFMVYRGQGMAKEDFDKMTKTKGGLLSFNNFLSTSTELEVSLNCANRAATNPDLVGILFVMTIDPSKSTIPFASITDVSYYKDKEDEVLFSMHTVFRICNIISLNENYRLFQVELTLTSDNDKDLRVLTDHIREKSFPNAEGWDRLSLVLLKMGQSEKAEQVYEILLGQATEESEKAPIYHQLGWVKGEQGEHTEAITFYEKSLQIYKKTLPPNDPRLATSYNSIGVVYDDMGEYLTALSYYEKALEIRKQSLPPNHLDLASSYNNIGTLHGQMGEHANALPNFERSIEIQKQSLPATHPDLATSYNNIGLVYENMGEYSRALSYYEKSFEIDRQSLPPNHPDLAASYDNIGIVYEHMGNYLQARSFFESAVEIAQCSLPSNHPNLQKWKKHLDKVKTKL